MTLPLYILRRGIMPGGNRLSKLKAPDTIVGICATCSLNVVRKKTANVEQLEGRWYMNELYHFGCVPDSKPLHRVKSKFLKGNINDEEYRFWIGARENFTQFAMCRACRTSTYGPQERELHFDNPKFAVAGDQCTVRLVRAYAKLATLSTCLVCKKSRWNNTKWGVPLCADPTCLNEWMFSQERWIPLEAHLRAQLKKAGLMKDGPIMPIISSSVRPWCPTCRIFADEINHEEIHKARVLSGQDLSQMD